MYLMKLPKLRFELAEKFALIMGAKLYNDLPTEARKEQNLSLFPTN